MPIPPNDQQSAPTRGDLLAAIALLGTRLTAIEASLATIQSVAINTGTAADTAASSAAEAASGVTSARAELAALDARLTGGTDDPDEDPAGWAGAILTAARTD